MKGSGMPTHSIKVFFSSRNDKGGNKKTKLDEILFDIAISN